jgi:hypothetical protein
MVIGTAWSPEIAVQGFGNEGQIPIIRATVGGERADFAINSIAESLMYLWA